MVIIMQLPIDNDDYVLLTSVSISLLPIPAVVILVVLYTETNTISRLHVALSIESIIYLITKSLVSLLVL